MSRKPSLILALCSCIVLQVSLLKAQTCSNYGGDTNLGSQTANGTADHVFGDHGVSMGVHSSCFYSSGSTHTSYCNSQCHVNNQSPTSESDTGTHNSGACHLVGSAWNPGVSSATNGGSSCTAHMGGGAAQCATPSCNCTIGVVFQTGVLNVSSNSQVI